MAGRCPAESSVRQKKKFPAAKSVPPHANSSVRSAAKNEAMPAGATRSDLLAHRSRLLAQADGENLQRRQNFQRPAPRARQIFARALNTVVTATHDEPMLRSPVPYEFAGRRQIALEMAGMKGCSAKCSWNTAEARNHLNGNAPAGDLRRGTKVSVKTVNSLRQIKRPDYGFFLRFHIEDQRWSSIRERVRKKTPEAGISGVSAKLLMRCSCSRQSAELSFDGTH